MGYTKTAVHGISWITLLRISTRSITFVRLAILGRLLTPTQFGYFGIATLFLSLIEIITETGINVFLVQEKSHIQKYINSAWAVSIIRGIILSIIILSTAGFVASIFNAPDAYPIIALISLVPLIRGFINPAIITYQKELLFNKEFKFRFILFAIDVVVSIIFGLITKSAISFVYGLIASAILEVILSYTLIPLWPKLKFEWEKIKYIIRRGWWVTATGIFSYFAENGDTITVGKIAGSASLGIYQIAYKFSTLPISEITNVVNQVVFPVYTKFSDDKERLWKALWKVILLSGSGAIIFGIIITLYAEQIITIVMGPQWTQAIPVVQILTIYGVLRTIFGNFAPLFLAIGKQNYVAQMTFARVITLALLIIPLVMLYGMIGAGYAMLFSIIAEIPLIIYFTHRIFKKNQPKISTI